jgi:Tol biopolymer transport system component
MLRTFSIIALAACLITAGRLACAGPNTIELKSYRVLVADYSKTSGGSEPSVSPDGKTLAFRASDEIWICHWADASTSESREQPAPWKLAFDVPKNGARRAREELLVADTRSIEWSPDGKRLAFVYWDGGLYIAENFDFTAKSASVRPLASAGLAGVLNPRWSPNGKKLALIRRKDVCVLDLDTGKEVTLADDASAWYQPWSPDGRYLTYSSMDRKIKVVSIDGQQKRQITDDGLCSCPSWSPKSNRIAFTFMYIPDPGEISLDGISSGMISGMTGRICIIDSEGKGRKVISATSPPTKAEAAIIKAEIDRATRVAFQKEFRTALTQKQTNLLRQGRLSLSAMRKIALLTAAHETGGSVERVVKTMADDLASGDQRRSKKAREALDRALEALNEDQAREFNERAHNFEFEGLFGGGRQRIGWTRDCDPVWSPDGGRIAFVRRAFEQTESALFVVDLANGRKRPLYSSGNIGCVTWTSTGQLLIESRRNMMMMSENYTPGYPEVWLLELR